MGHGDSLQVEDHGSTEDLSPRLENAELEDDDGRLEDLLHRVLPRIPIPQTVYHYPSPALGPVRGHGNNVVVSYVLHLERPYVLMDLRVLLFEVAVIHDLENRIFTDVSTRVFKLFSQGRNIIFE